MRWLILLILAALAFYYFAPEPEPTPIEDTFVGDEIRAVKKAQDFEQEFLDATKAQQQRMEEQLEDASGG
ncbi:MAG: hypothetical protein HKN58_08905 [Xanthomonadales bacterium]|nr:hypothetical protein [Xanthomonadales bacterium]